MAEFTKIFAYTDGCAEPNPGPGAWGVHMKLPEGGVIEAFKAEPDTTNQRMELMGPIWVLENAAPRTTYVIYSDSQYVVKGITTWIQRWKKEGWRTSTKNPVANRDLWERLDAAVAAINCGVRFEWVRGHSEEEGNVIADALARDALLESLRGDREALEAAQRGFNRHGDLDVDIEEYL